jgi:hypothetical protein
VASTLGSSAGGTPPGAASDWRRQARRKPKDWVKAFPWSLQPLVRIASRIWSWVCSIPRLARRPRGCRLRPPSRATQHINLEYKKSPGSPRISQIPWSLPPSAARGRRPARRRNIVGLGPDRGRTPPVRRGHWPNPSGGVVEQVVREAVNGAEQFAVDVKLALVPGTVADPSGGRVSPALQVRQLPLGQVPFAPDTEHDRQLAASVKRAGRGGSHIVEELIGFVGTGRHPQEPRS